MDELVASSLRSMQAGLAPLKQQAPAAASSEHGSINGAVTSDLATAAEAVKTEVSFICSSSSRVLARQVTPLLMEVLMLL